MPSFPTEENGVHCNGSGKITKIGVIGVGVMGSMLALLLAENGISVSIYDRSEHNLLAAAEKATDEGYDSKVSICRDYDELCQSLGSPKVLMLSLPNGAPGNGVIQTLQPFLTKNDIIIDCSNENFKVTQERQAKVQSRGVSYIGMGVSGGFSGARHGPSLMPSGDDWALDRIFPILVTIAAKDDQGNPCVAKIGPGGSGHYVKMIHNGIEHGIMSALCEAWEIMDKCLGMKSEAIGQAFEDWSSRDELKDNLLVAISGPICRTKDAKGQVLLHQIKDAIVQDVNHTEGTGVWANIEAVTSHVPAPSLSAAHNLRLASSNISKRASLAKSFGSITPKAIELSTSQLSIFLEDLRKALYCTILACFVQGYDIMSRASEQEGWGLDLRRISQIWRAGCIIKSHHITDLFEGHYAEGVSTHPLENEHISREMRECWPSLKHVTVKAMEADAHLPCFSATTEYLKYIGSVDLPTCFMQAQADSFGAHGYDLKTEVVKEFMKGKYHDDWCLA